MKRIYDMDIFNECIQQPIFLLLVKTTGCGVCEAVEIQINEWLKQYPNLPNGLLYVDDLPLFRGQYLVFTAPTILIFQNGNEVKRYSRIIPFKELTTFIDRITDM